MGGETKLTNSDLHVAVSRHLLRHSFFMSHLEADKQFSPEMIAEMEDAYVQSMNYAQRNFESTSENTYVRGLTQNVLTQTMKVANAAHEAGLISPEGRESLVRVFICYNLDYMKEMWGDNSAYPHNLAKSVSEFIRKPVKRGAAEVVNAAVPHEPHN